MKLRHIECLCLLFGMASFGTALAQDNTIYIDQVGAGSNIDLTQDGSGNIIAGNEAGTSAMKIEGDNSSVSIDTVGDSNKVIGNFIGTTDTTINVDGDTNTLAVDVDPSDIYGGENSDIKIDLDGNNASIDLDIATEDQATGLVLDWTLQGDYFNLDYNIDSNDADSYLDIDGDNVSIAYDADGYDGHTSSITGVGNNIDITIDQQSTLQSDNVTVEFSGSGTTASPATLCISQSDSGTATGC